MNDMSAALFITMFIMIYTRSDNILVPWEVTQIHGVQRWYQ